MPVRLVDLGLTGARPGPGGFRRLRNRNRRPAVISHHHPIGGPGAREPIAFVINSCPVTSAPPAAADGVRMSPFRAETRTRISVTRRPGVFGSVGTGEDLAATGRIRELFLGGLTGPARPCATAYTPSRRV